MKRGQRVESVGPSSRVASQDGCAVACRYQWSIRSARRELVHLPEGRLSGLAADGRSKVVDNIPGDGDGDAASLFEQEAGSAAIECHHRAAERHRFGHGPTGRVAQARSNENVGSLDRGDDLGSRPVAVQVHAPIQTELVDQLPNGFLLGPLAVQVEVPTGQLRSGQRGDGDPWSLPRDEAPHEDGASAAGGRRPLVRVDRRIDGHVRFDRNGSVTAESTFDVPIHRDREGSSGRKSLTDQFPSWSGHSDPQQLVHHAAGAEPPPQGKSRLDRAAHRTPHQRDVLKLRRCPSAASPRRS